MSDMSPHLLDSTGARMMAAHTLGKMAAPVTLLREKQTTAQRFYDYCRTFPMLPNKILQSLHNTSATGTSRPYAQNSSCARHLVAL